MPKSRAAIFDDKVYDGIFFFVIFLRPGILVEAVVERLSVLLSWVSRRTQKTSVQS